MGVIYIEPVEMFKGEKRIITVEISSCDPDPFTIRKPTYEFKYGDSVEDKGIPIMQDHELTIIVEPKNSGRYTLECRMEIANEVIIRKLPVFVRE